VKAREIRRKVEERTALFMSWLEATTHKEF